MLSVEMGEIFVRNGKYICSTQIADKYNKMHKNVLKDIRSILKREKEFAIEFVEGAYRNSRGQILPCYYLTKKAVKRLNDRYKYNSKCASLEKAFGQWLNVLFPNQTIVKQYPVLGYRIDFYLQELNIAVEYDEYEHTYQVEDDKNRQTEIQNHLQCTFVRVKQGKEIEGIKELLFVIQRKTGNNPLFFMY